MGNLVQHVSQQSNVIASTNEPLNNLAVPLPNPTLPGNTLVATVAYPSGAVLAITDDKGNSWPISGNTGTVTADAGGGAMALQSFVLNSCITGTTVVKAGFGSSVYQPVKMWVSEYQGVVGAVLGTASAANVNSSGVVSPGAFTPSSANALVLAYMCDANTVGGTNPTLISAASGYALNDADISWDQGQGSPSASQWQLQTSAASTTASFTLTAGGGETYNVVAIALSTGTQGTAPAPGIHIDRVLYFSSNSNGASYKLQIPSTGNLGFLGSITDPVGTGTISATDSDSVTWSVQGQVNGPILMYRQNQPPSTTRTITLNLAGHTGQNVIFRYMDISGAATSAYDTSAFLVPTGTSNVNSIANAPSITPSTANGLVIAILGNGLGPTLGATAPTGVMFDEANYDTAQFTAGISGTTLTLAATAWGTFEAGGINAISGGTTAVGTTVQSGTGPTYTVNPSQTVSSGTTMKQSSSDSSNINWGNGLAHVYNSTATALSFTWTIANQPSSSVDAAAIAFKAAPTGANTASIAWVV